jgi:hypothetical protein
LKPACLKCLKFSFLQYDFPTVYVGATLDVGTLNDNPVGIYTGSYTITFDFNGPAVWLRRRQPLAERSEPGEANHEPIEPTMSLL